jgi:thioredoxin reductase
VTERYDVVVVGGGSAGMAAALWLARYRRRVLVIDVGEPRNRATWAVHGYPGIADPTPTELRRLTQAQMLAAGAERRHGCVTGVEGEKDRFHIRADGGLEVEARRVVLCYGLSDRLPALEGLEQIYGSSVFHCPDCDGPSMSGARVGVFGHDRQAARLALYLQTWARDVMLLLHGEAPELDQAARDTLERRGVRTVPGRILRLEQVGQALSGCTLEDGESISLDGIFFHLGAEPATSLARDLGCDHDDEGYVTVDSSQETSVAGVYAAGDLTGTPHLAIWAAAEGVKAALAIHRSLLPPELELTGDR